MEITVFIGDSVTDCDRLSSPPLGSGYVSKIAASSRLQGSIINVGTSGHRLVDLEARWETDVNSHNPSILSVAIGINDVWRRYDDNDPTFIADFELRYRRVLDSARAASNPTFVLCEPFLLEVQSEMLDWREDLNPKIDVVHKLAIEYGAHLVKFDREFARLAEETSMQKLAEDGIHPTDLGHQIMAELWLKELSL